MKTPLLFGRSSLFRVFVKREFTVLKRIFFSLHVTLYIQMCKWEIKERTNVQCIYTIPIFPGTLHTKSLSYLGSIYMIHSWMTKQLSTILCSTGQGVLIMSCRKENTPKSCKSSCYRAHAKALGYMCIVCCTISRKYIIFSSPQQLTKHTPFFSRGGRNIFTIYTQCKYLLYSAITCYDQYSQQ